MRMQITFRSGAQIEVDVDSFELGRNKVTRELVSLNWETPEGWSSKLHAITDIGEILAVVALEDRQSPVAAVVEPITQEVGSDG